jgi:hypothetical protein
VEAVLEQLQKASTMEIQLTTLSRKLLWMWHGDNSETQEGECPLLEAGTRGLMRQETEKTQCLCNEL